MSSYQIGRITDPEDVFRNSVIWDRLLEPTYLMHVTHTLRIGGTTFPMGPVVRAVPGGAVGELQIGALQRESLRVHQGHQISFREVREPDIAAFVVLDGVVDAAAVDGCVVANGYRLAVRGDTGCRVLTVLSLSHQLCAIIRAGVTEIRFAERDPADLC